MPVYFLSFTLLFWLLGSVACTIAPPIANSTATSNFTIAQASATATEAQSQAAAANHCPVTAAVWLKPPPDAAVQSAPAFGYYFVNEDESIWASAFGTSAVEDQVSRRADGIKVGWFRPAGATLAISGQRIDAPAAPLNAQIPCCYPTRFQATGLFFPTAGCWEVTAKAAERALTFMVWVQ